jgi:hypothetical protein
MSVDTFGSFPGFPPVSESWNVLCLIYLVFAYPWLKPKGHSRTSAFEIYLLALITIPPFWMGLCAAREFGQPILYGMLAVRGLIRIASVLFFTRALRSGFFTVEDVKTAIPVLAWSLAILYTTMKVFVTPPPYDKYVGLVGVSGNFIFKSDFLIFGVFYYAFVGFRTRSAKSYLLALLLLAAAMDPTGNRQMVVGILVSFLFFVYRWASWRRLLILLPKIVLGLALILTALYIASPGETSNRIAKFGDAFSVVLTGQQVDDPSANMHYIEFLYALPAIAKHPIVGNGRVSSQWQGGGDAVRETHFYPEDIGMFGLIYQYGLLGFILFGAQFVFAFRAAQNLQGQSPIVDAAKGFLLYLALVSCMGWAAFAFSPVLSLFSIALLRSAAERAPSMESTTSSLMLLNAKPQHP